MTTTLLGLTFALMLASVVLVARSFRRDDPDAALIGMVAMLAATVPAFAYAGITG